MVFTIVYTEGVPDKLRRDGRAARPGFDDRFFTSLIEVGYFFCELLINEWSFFKTTCHVYKVINR